MEKNNKKKYLVIGIITLALVTVIGITYSFFAIGDKQSLANTFTSGCLNISIENESNAINLNNVIPVTDVEGLSSTPFTFNIKNTCSTSTNYKINLESLNQVANTLHSDYIKVSLNSSTFDNIITKLSDNKKEETNVNNSYESHNLYVGSIEGNTTKTFNLRLWLDYDATKEQAASKTYTSKINVIANPEYEVVDNSEVKFNLEETTLVGTLNDVTNISYCKSEDIVCTPNTSIEITDNKIRIEMEVKDEKQIVCTKLNNKRVICSEPKIISLCPEGGSACKYILANKTIDERTDFSKVVTEDTTGTIYKAPDDDGTSYYYAGAVTDNWVYFGGFYWRIIRINGDGSIRLIYNGTTPDQTGEGTITSRSNYNTDYMNNAYGGYMYTSGQVHGLGTSSTLKNSVDNWYNSNLINYSQYIDVNAGFCNDREPSTSESTSNGLGGTGITSTYYAGYIRLVTRNQPSLKCTNSSDLFTKSGAIKGNKALTNPIGLITADEVVYAGGKYNVGNERFYLYSNQAYWTMTPYTYNVSYKYISIYSVWFGSFSSLASTTAEASTNSGGIRPVINLKANIDLAGDGTASNPYKIKSTKDDIITGLTKEDRTITSPLTANTTGKIYSANDDDGTSYYYAGAVDNNWVKFADKYWRIIRFNGDGTVRLIYSGTSAIATGEGTQTTTSVYNANYNDNAYVGFMYGQTGSSTYAATHANTNNSTIKGVLDSWYTSNLASYADKIDMNAGFCNDRKVDKTANSGYQGDGYGTSQTGYAPWGRLYKSGSWKTTQTPSLTCSQANDLFTATSSTKGNKKLTYPIGLITIDEVVFGGGFGGSKNVSYYLCTGRDYWTISPYYFSAVTSYAYVFYVDSGGNFTSYSVNNTRDVRPVINLKADTIFTGSGTSTDPYIVQ